jgi:serine/threonine protein kinase
LNHLLIFGFEGYIPGSGTGKEAIVTEFMPNDSLYDHLPSNPSASSLSLLRRDTTIPVMTARTVFVTRYLLSRGFIHRDLQPDNGLLDWN